MMKKISKEEAIAVALEGSIDKWQKIVNYLTKTRYDIDWDKVQKLEYGCDNCPLCQMFALCGDCPVMLKTGWMACDKTPYVDFANAKALKNLKVCRESAKAELKFLKSLRE